MEQNSDTKDPANPPISARERFDLHLELLIQKNHPRIMNLEQTIPMDYPWEAFLQTHFSKPSFVLERTDYEWVVQGKSKTLKLRDSRKPTTFYSLLRFLEYFRTSLVQLERNLAVIEQQHDKLRQTAREQVGIRNLFGRKWDYETISNKHEVMADALRQKSRLDGVRHKLETILADNLNVTSRWQFLIEPFFAATVTYINTHFEDGSFNLRRFYPVRSMETLLAPHYEEAMELAVDLNEAVTQTTEFLGRHRTQKIAKVTH